MANLEVLALDPTAPQIEAPQTGNGYSMPRLVNIAPEAVTGTATTPSLAIAQAWSTTGAATALQVNVTSDTGPSVGSKLLDLQVGGVSKAYVTKTGVITANGYAGIDGNIGMAVNTFYIGPVGSGASWIWPTANTSTGGVSLTALQSFSWSSGSSNATPPGDLALYRDAANTLALRNGVNAQAFNLYNTYTSGSVYERGVFDWTTTANVLSIGTQAAGTGVARDLSLITGGTVRQNIKADGTEIRWTVANGRQMYLDSNCNIQFTNSASGIVGGQIFGNSFVASNTFGSGSGGNQLVTYSGGSVGSVTQGGYLQVAGGSHANRGSFSLLGATQIVDQSPGNSTIVGASAFPTATTNITGAQLAISGGEGASSSAGAAHGGNVSISGGTGYGTGHKGYILMPNLPTSSAGLPTGALWNNLGILSIA